MHGNGHGLHMPPRFASVGGWRNLLRPERQNDITLTEFIASLNRSQTASVPEHLFGAMVILIGLELLGPALLISTGYFNNLLKLFPPSLPVVFAVMAVIGAGTLMTGTVLFVRALRVRH